eukprot:768256-Hanusia_phi.AAC.1
MTTAAAIPAAKARRQKGAISVLGEREAFGAQQGGRVMTTTLGHKIILPAANQVHLPRGGRWGGSGCDRW